jgi:hypothetical protein
LDDWQQDLVNYGKSAPEKNGVLSQLVGKSLSEGKDAEITGKSPCLLIVLRCMLSPRQKRRAMAQSQ